MVMVLEQRVVSEGPGFKLHRLTIYLLGQLDIHCLSTTEQLKFLRKLLSDVGIEHHVDNFKIYLYI